MLAVTFVSTLALQLEFAIFVGVLVSLLVYLNRTTHPQLTPVAPDRASPQRRFVADHRRRRRPRRMSATRDAARRRVDVLRRRRARARRNARAARGARPSGAHILLIGSGINFVDVAGAELLVHEAKLRATRRRALPVQPEAGGARGAGTRRLPRRASAATACSGRRTRRSARSTRASTARAAAPARRASSSSAGRCCRTDRAVSDAGRLGHQRAPAPVARAQRRSSPGAKTCSSRAVFQPAGRPAAR